jgi:hypothetical protein
MVLTATLNNLKEALVPVAVDLLRSTATRTSIGDAERLQVLNRMVLFGPMFQVLEPLLSPCVIPEGGSVRNEIGILADIPEGYIVGGNVGGFIDIELEKLVHPQIEGTFDGPIRVDALFQACTDVRRIAFGRTINFLAGTPSIPQEAFRNPDIQRAISFASWVRVSRKMPFAAWEKVAAFNDPAALLIVLDSVTAAVEHCPDDEHLLAETLARLSNKVLPVSPS